MERLVLRKRNSVSRVSRSNLRQIPTLKPFRRPRSHLYDLERRCGPLWVDSRAKGAISTEREYRAGIHREGREALQNCQVRLRGCVWIARLGRERRRRIRGSVELPIRLHFDGTARSWLARLVALASDSQPHFLSDLAAFGLESMSKFGDSPSLDSRSDSPRSPSHSASLATSEGTDETTIPDQSLDPIPFPLLDPFPFLRLNPPTLSSTPLDSTPVSLSTPQHRSPPSSRWNSTRLESIAPAPSTRSLLPLLLNPLQVMKLHVLPSI